MALWPSRRYTACGFGLNNKICCIWPHYSFWGVYSLSDAFKLWGLCDERGLTSYKFVVAENIFPFVWRRVLTMALLLWFITLLNCLNSELCLCVWAFLAGIAYGSVYFPSLSRKLDTPARPNRSSTFVLTVVERLHFLPRSLTFYRKELWLQFKGVCVYIHVCVCVHVWEGEGVGELEVTCAV